MNEVDLDLEAHFDSNIYAPRKNSVNTPYQMDGLTSPQGIPFQGGFQSSSHSLGGNTITNSRLANTIKKLEHDFYENVPCNCCFLDILPVLDSYNKYNDTIFMGTYDGHLHAIRLEVEANDKQEQLVLKHIKKWTFSYPIMSVIAFDMYNFLNDPKMNNLRSSSTCLAMIRYMN